MRPQPQLQLQIACADHRVVPNLGRIERWIGAALAQAGRRGELTVRVVDQSEMADLNHRYRGKSGATDVLSFPFEAEAAADLPLEILGDVVICAPLVAAQAESLGVPLMDHWAHIVIHGVLHLCGWDHQLVAQAERMESLERDILATLGIPRPPSPE